MTESEAYLAALRLLTRSDRSEAELAARLRRRGFPDADITAALGRCRELGYLNDRKLAETRARQLAGSGRAVGARLLFELGRRGFSREQAAEAAQQAEKELCPEQLILRLLAQKFPDFTPGEADDREKRRVTAFLQRRGFSLSAIFSAFDSYPGHRTE